MLQMEGLNVPEGVPYCLSKVDHAMVKNRDDEKEHDVHEKHLRDLPNGSALQGSQTSLALTALLRTGREGRAAERGGRESRR